MFKVRNYIDREWVESSAAEQVLIHNPATAEVLGSVPLSPAEEVDRAAQAAAAAFQDWRRTPAGERVQYLFKLKQLLEQEFEELARSITIENGKTLKESRGELRRAIENVEVACGIPTLIQGYNSEDIAPGIDEIMIRQPVGVAAAICPFNFPGMIPFWFMPYALACGNTYVLKPSEKVPLTMARIFELLEQAGFPKGVVNLVNGAKETVEAILDHPLIRAVSFVGSTAVARQVYARAAAHGKRAQVQGGAKNPVDRPARCGYGDDQADRLRQPPSATPANAAWPPRWPSPWEPPGGSSPRRSVRRRRSGWWATAWTKAWRWGR